MSDQDKPLIPTLKDSQKPQLKIKGLASGGMSLIDRLKQFKKKDLAFILAGLGVLFMAPLAEHFMMAPEGGESGAFKEGWGFRDGANSFGKGGSPYEGGVNGLAPGGMAGGGSDVITPLNVRDPSALVMGPGATQQAPATASTPAPAAPPKENSDWKDALANAASKGASAATKRASLPVPKVPLSNGGLRGLGAVSGGGGGSFNLGPISAGNVPNRGANGPSSLNSARGTQGYRGAAGPRGSQNGSAGSMEALKKAAGLAGSDFNRAGGAATNLESAANRGMGEGTGGGGAGEGAGGGDKAASQSQSKDSKSADGQSLAFLRAKANQDKEIELAWKLKEKEAMRWPNLYDKMLEEAIMTPFKGLTGLIADKVKKFGTGSDEDFSCWVKIGDSIQTTIINDGDVGECNAGSSKESAEAGGKKFYAYGKARDKIYIDQDCGQGQKPPWNCTGAKGDPTPPGENNDAVDSVGGVGSEDQPGSYTRGLDRICSKLKTLTGGQAVAGRTEAAGFGDKVKTAANLLIGAGGSMVSASDAMTTGSNSGTCDAAGISVSARPSRGTLLDIRDRIAGPLSLSYGKSLARGEQGAKYILGGADGSAVTADSPVMVNVGKIKKYFDAARAAGGLPAAPAELAAGQTGLTDTIYNTQLLPLYSGTQYDDVKNLNGDNTALTAAQADLAIIAGYKASVTNAVTDAEAKLASAEDAVNQLDSANKEQFTKWRDTMRDRAKTIRASHDKQFGSDGAGGQFKELGGADGNGGAVAAEKAQRPVILADRDNTVGSIKGPTNGADGNPTAVDQSFNNLQDSLSAAKLKLPSSIPAAGDDRRTALGSGAADNADAPVTAGEDATGVGSVGVAYKTFTDRAGGESPNFGAALDAANPGPSVKVHKDLADTRKGTRANYTKDIETPLRTAGYTGAPAAPAPTTGGSGSR